MPVEGRDLSSRQTQYVVRDLDIGKPINCEECSETADGVTRESEGRSRLSLLRPSRFSDGIIQRMRALGRRPLSSNARATQPGRHRPALSKSRLSASDASFA